jgi:hypothetical protein
MLGLAWSAPGRQRRSHRPTTVVPWPASGGKKEEGESERAGLVYWVGQREQAAHERKREECGRKRAARACLSRPSEGRRRANGSCCQFSFFFFQKCE